MAAEPWQFPAIDPVIFSLGPVSLHWYGLMYLIGFAGAMYFANSRVGQHDCYWNKEQISDLLFYGFLGVILGGRIGYVFFYQFELFLENPLYLFKIWEGGMSFHGGFLGVLVAFAWFAKKSNTTFLQVADFIAPMVPIGLGAGRIGNFINAELWGRTTDVPWAIVFPGAGELGRHPSQLYEFFLEGLVLFLFLNWFRQSPRPVGAVAGCFSLGYGAFRFIVEYFREPDAHLQDFMNGYITMGQVLSLPMVILGLVILVWAYRQPVRQGEKQA
ncbi:prolipoprotein diacylglyceryl transferase [Saccharobesus litoralis]|uniref:Phosphatidylglycerol--prolipoprotein diacylglyceryl transferase n=1 Tax=Saccharobesus litoralis TaxID=2172099 RepID=A0A2S0VWG3_9ALTE|nr:prolipoprotein diacylglyceryl transferase [Saccharobesus litoralis]AWB68551.1 prolipoprotein diacylglyceryl transferase [Saccharobesus litoralis]